MASRRESEAVVAAARRLSDTVNRLQFAPPVSHTYNPLSYAWSAHESYLRRYATGRKRVIFLGMNPGPFGMAQTGVPFGQIAAVRDWLGIKAKVGRPPNEHPSRPITGFDCTRSEISGERLWGLFAVRFGTAAAFARQHLVMNYCPLAFLEESGRNRTPDKLPTRERVTLFAACDTHLLEVARLLQPDWVIGIGDFAARRATEVLAGNSIKVARILHPSPANPAANRDWVGTVTRQLRDLGVWS